MELSWFQSILLGFLSGLTEILPVSAQAHRIVALKLFGNGVTMHPMVELFLHMGTLVGLYLGCRSHIARIMRAQRLSQIPAKRRKRPLDTRSMMDFKLLITILAPTVIAFFFFEKAQSIAGKLPLVALFVLLNGLILYVPQYLPGANKDARNLSPLEGLLIGLGGAASLIPGISCVGAGISVATVCGADRQYALRISLIMAIPVTIGLIAMDFLAVLGGVTLTFGLLFNCLLAAGAAFAGVILGIRLLRAILAQISTAVFGVYCMGMALFTFILYLTAA